MPVASSIDPNRIDDAIIRTLEEGRIAALATLVSGPGSVGAKLLVTETGARFGGTHDPRLDEALAERATAFLASRVETVTLTVDELAPQLIAWHGARVMFERIEPEPRIIICGAGHVGAALARLSHLIGYRTTLIDDRAEFLTRERFPETGIELVVAETWTQAVRAAVGSGRGVSVAVVTRGHNEDEECLRAVIAARPDYVGMIGSKRRTNIVLKRLRATGCDETVLNAVRAPIGLDIGAVTPEEVALSILAEIIAERRGGTYLPLSAWRRR
jgi:xanthine dehydrogenase accessory factor